jgi:hypothetical protein
VPKLPKEKAKSTDEAESNFEALEEGIYLGTLEEVTTAEGPKGEYWTWRFSDLIFIETDAKAPGSLWVNTSLSPEAEWKLKEVFEAFGVKANTDTDTLLGDKAQLAVEQRVIEKGARMGEIGNSVVKVMAVGADE